MELADSYESLSDVPPEHLVLYTEKDGKAVLDFTGLKTKQDFDRYATALRARLGDATGDLKTVQGAGLTRDEIMSAITDAAAKLVPPKPNGQGGGGGGSGDDTALTQRVHDLERELEATKEKLTTATSEREAAQSQATTTTIKNALTGSAVKSGVRTEAVDALVKLVESSFELAGDGKVVTKLEGGADGVTPNSSPDDYFAAIKRSDGYSYFWPASKGGGAQPPGGGGGGGDADNPWSKKGWNLTAQGQQVRADRARAEELAKQAGSRIGATKPPE